MHRTQILIDEKHYAFLKKKSEQEKKSISQVLREMLDRYAKRSKAYSLSSIAGIGEDGEVDKIWITPSDEKQAWNLFISRNDKSYSFTDCTSFVVMRRMKIKKMPFA
ncbi:MAG: hypothetical protein OHK0032_14560 [Thermodesulfovibrionales bacterium]